MKLPSEDQLRNNTNVISHLSHFGRLCLIENMIQSHEEVARLHLCTLTSCHVTAAITLTILYGAAAETNKFLLIFTK